MLLYLHSSSSWDREWSNIYEVYVTDSDGSSINFSMNRDMAVITICQYDYSDGKWWGYTQVSASDNYTLSTASLPVRQYNSEGKPAVALWLRGFRSVFTRGLAFSAAADREGE